MEMLSLITLDDDDGLLCSAAVLLRLSLLLLLMSDDDFFRENRNDPSDRNSFLFFIIAIVGRGSDFFEYYNKLQHYNINLHSVLCSFCIQLDLFLARGAGVRKGILVGVVSVIYWNTSKGEGVLFVASPLLDHESYGDGGVVLTHGDHMTKK